MAPLFAALRVFADTTARPGPEQMALDEVLLEAGGAVWLRTFTWDGPWVSFGCAQSLTAMQALAAGRPVVRRWTGGGLVEHHADWTFSLIVPRSDPAAGLRPTRFYQVLHEAISRALASCGVGARLARPEDLRPGPACFTAPVEADVLSPEGRKLCGGAQRRSRAGILHQGSLQNLNVSARFHLVLARELAGRVKEDCPGEDLVQRARVLAREKYGHPDWQARVP